MKALISLLVFVALVSAAAHAQAAERLLFSDYLADLPEEQERVWRDFARAAGMSDAELAAFRAAVPQADYNDVLWVSHVQSFGEGVLQENWPMAAYELFATPDVQVLFKMTADMLYGAATILEPSDPPHLEAELWRRFALEISDMADLEGVPSEYTAIDALWVHAAGEYDAATLLQESVTAAQLLTMPDYQLRRKLIIDGYVTMIVNCVRCALAPTPACAQRCQDLYLLQVDTCTAIARVCELNRFARQFCRRALAQCTCSADCARCLCAGGQLSSEQGCLAQCESTSHDCVSIAPFNPP